MKKSAITAIAIAGIAILGGGGAIAATTLTNDDTPASATETPAPVATTTPETTVAPEPDYTGTQAQVVTYWVDRGEISEAEVVTRLDETCAAIAAGEPYEEVIAFPEGTPTTNSDFRTDATAMWCPTE